MAEAKKAAKSKTKTVETKEKQIKHAEVVAETASTTGSAPAEIEVEPVKAKAGKRSAKAVKETEEKQAKQARKANAVATSSKPTPKPARARSERAGKKYREAVKLIDKTKAYPIAEALDLAARTTTTKFDASIELHINLGVDPKQADQNVRGTVALPAGTGKSVKIAVLAEAEDAVKAKTAGAELVGVDEVFAKLDKEELDFDVLIATPATMPKLGKYARLLGPRGLMPNPKSGTVSQNPAEAVKEAKGGRVEYRVDQAGIIHLSIGKASFGVEKLVQNAETVLSSVRAARPASLKGIYIKSIYASSTMGPSIKMEIAA